MLIPNPQDIRVPKCFLGSSNFGVQKDMLTGKVRNGLLLRMTSKHGTILNGMPVVSPVRD